MKLSNKLFLSSNLMLLFFVISCSQREISSDKLQERNGITYAVNETKPYSGKVIATYRNEQRKFEKEYKDGLLDDLSTEWYRNGQNKSEISYKAGLQSGNFKTWHENGQQFDKGANKDGKKDGKWISWYSNGHRESEKEYVDGKLNGLSNEWYSNGDKKSEIFYTMGQLSGIYSTWYENDKQSKQGSYKDNKKNGKWTYWYSNGQKETEGEYQLGKKIGNWDYWTKDGWKFGPIKDIDGNTYKTVKIGDQIWMAENLKVTRYRNGDPIPNVTNNSEWGKLKTGAYCNYENSSKNASIYGSLYNWYAVKDKRGLAPKGWHIPTDKEWTELENYLGTNAGGKMKTRGTKYWSSPNEGATNSSGFSALPGGDRYGDGAFLSISGYGNWWSSTESNNLYVRSRYLSYSDSAVYRGGNYRRSGFSVRCIKD